MTTNQKPNYTLPIIVMFFLFAMISFVTGFQNPFGVILKNSLGLSNLQSQLGNAANFIAYAFMGIPAGMVLQKKGYKFTAITAVIVGLVGVAIMFFSSTLNPEDVSLLFGVYLTGAFVAGFSMCLLNTVVNPMLNTLGGGGKKGNQLLQFGGATNSLAATICPVLVGYLMGDIANTSMVNARPALYVAMGIFFLALIVLFLSKLPEPILEDIKRNGPKAKQPSLGGALKFSHYVGGVIAIFLYVGVEVGIPNFINLFMTSGAEHGGMGVDAGVVGSLVGAYWFLMLIGRLIGGSVGGSVSSRAMLAFVSGVALVLVLGAIFLDPSISVNVPFVGVSAPINVLLLILCGLCTSVMWGGIFNLAVEGLGKYTAVASGFFMVMVCGGGLLPLVQGVVADFAGYLASYWVIFAAVAYMLYYAVAGSRVKHVDDSAAQIKEEIKEGVMED